MFFNPMDPRMAWTADPHSMTKIGIIPVVINQFHRFQCRAEFTTIIIWIWSLVCNSSIIFAGPTFNSMIPSIIALCNSHLFAIALTIIFVSQISALFASARQSSRSKSIDRELIGWKCLLTIVASVVRRWFQALNQSGALGRTTTPLFLMGFWNKKCCVALGTLFSHASIIPRSLPFLEFIFVQMPGLHVQLEYSRISFSEQAA